MSRVLPRELRARLLVVLATGSIVLITVVIGGFNVVLRNQIRGDLDSRLSARASAVLSNVVVRHGRVRVRDAPGDQAIDQQVWVFAGGRVVAAPPEPPSALESARLSASHPGSYRNSETLDLRLHSVPIRSAGRVLGAVVASASLAPYETTARRALIASIVLGVIVLAGVLSAVRLAISAALRPVGRMTAEVAAWTVDDLDRRFPDADPHDELSRLASTFNDLLGRLAASFRHEQRFSAEISHELRTPLARLIVESELALRRERTLPEYKEAMSRVIDDARQMQRVVETLLAVARAQIDIRGGTADAVAVATTVVESLRRSHAGVALDVSGPATDVRVGVDSAVAERILAPIVANALEFASSRASVEVRVAQASVDFVVTDDGPGVPAEQREAIFTPGFSADPAPRRSGATRSNGLGLALARRLARTSDGDVVLDETRDVGAAFVVSLPAA